MSDWKISNYRDPTLGEIWVYYVYKDPNRIDFQDIHMSRSVDEPNQDHMATNDRNCYYFGVTKTFNRDDVPNDIQNNLKNAWKDYFTVQ